ncbi:fibronectin type III domain-containing protein [Mongoliitalea daihaiensis]|uniref:hypothetical protein n=1 Tax=Mongoliitalea daihaiensis TaxID=2782006 RepID=UPI001F4274B5|nr:hypothetical protein [Mongoliitalea daihaiensis]UJP66048.1 hypothetical protein IPZ59_05335 [Mongoliitalea daihaiensis]
MATFRTKLGTLFLFFLLLGVVVEGFGDVTRDCLICGGNRNADQLLLLNFRIQDESGSPITVDNCDNNEDFITISFQYNSVSGGEKHNTFIGAALFLVSTIDGSEQFAQDVLFNMGTLPNGSGLVSVTRTIPRPANFNCLNQRLELREINAVWLNRNNLAPICENYQGNTGICIRYPDVRRVSIDGFFYDFGAVADCFDENGDTEIIFSLTDLAGGSGNFDFIWTVNGENRSENLTDFAIRVPFQPGDAIDVQLRVIDRNNPSLVMQVPPENLIWNTEAFSAKVTPILTSQNPFIGGFVIEDLPGDVEDYRIILINLSDNTATTITELDFSGLGEGDYELIIIDENGISRCFTLLIDFTILPVIYADLTLTFNPEQRAINFRWSTTKEWEASHFEIERADRGNKFHKIGEVDARGWSDELTHYNFEDKNLPLTGGNLLYRLKQVDFNGKSEYSEVLSVRQVPRMETTQGVWRAFPNPTNGSTFKVGLLDRSNYGDEPITFRLVHPLFQTAPITVNTEIEMNNQLALQISRVPKGIFVVEIQWERKIEHIKVLKN